jgi:uncharacterized protein (TIGR03084 family)
VTSALDDLRSELGAEQEALDAVVASIDDDQWRWPTPSPGWTVADQIGHLAFFDRSAATAITDVEKFREELNALIDAIASDGLDDFTLRSYREMKGSELLERWRQNRKLLNEAAQTLTDDSRLPWYGPSMSAKSFLSARLMETWAHGTDVVDALKTTRPATDRLRHIAKLGYLTRAWSYGVRGKDVPTEDIRVDLIGPSGDVWSWGPDDADESVTGSAEEFCLVVTQRRHVDDTSLKYGELGRDWLIRAQAFAGGPSEGPQPKGNR